MTADSVISPKAAVQETQGGLQEFSVTQAVRATSMVTGSGKSYLASTIYGKKGTLYTYDCAPVGEEVIEKELLGEGSMISPLSGIYAVIIKHIDRLSPRLQRAVLEKMRKSRHCACGAF